MVKIPKDNKKMNKKFVINVIVCLVSFATTIITNFFLAPIITKSLSEEAYGFITLANNFVNFASVITLALNSMAARFISVSIFKKDYEEANKYFTSVFLTNIFLILLFLIPSIFCIGFLDKIINISIPLVKSVKVLFAIIFLNFYLSLINSTYSVSTTAGDRVELFTLRNMEASLLKFVFTFLLFYICGASIVVVGIGSLIATLYLLFFNVRYTKKLLPFIKIKKEYFDIKKIWIILKAGVWNTLTKIGQILSDGLDLLITNIFINPQKMGELSIAKTISSSVSLLTMLLSNIFQPNLLKYYSTNDDKIVDELNFSMKINALFTNVIIIGIICFGFDFYKLWLPGSDTNLLTSLTIITLLGSIIGNTVNILYSVFTITNKVKVNAISVLIHGLSSITIVYIILKLNIIKEPIYVVASVSVILGIIKNITFTPIYSAMCLKIKKSTFYPTILKSFLASGITAILFMIINYFLNINSWLKLFLVAFFAGIIGLIVHLLILFNVKEIKNSVQRFTKIKGEKVNES